MRHYSDNAHWWLLELSSRRSKRIAAAPELASETFVEKLERLREASEAADRDFAAFVLEHEDNCSPATIRHARWLLMHAPWMSIKGASE
jgi:uncharacterized damage-inducible protein DinB